MSIRSKSVKTFPQGVDTSRFVGDGQGPEGSNESSVQELLKKKGGIQEFIHWTLPLPVDKKTLERRFGSEILLTDSSPEGIQHDSSFVGNAILQADYLVTGFDLLLDGNSISFTATTPQGKVVYGTPAWEAARCLFRGYRLQWILNQRYLLADEELCTAATLGSRREPIQKGKTDIRPYLQEINDRYHALQLMDADESLGTPDTLVEATWDSRYLVEGEPGMSKFDKPILLERGQPIGIKLIAIHPETSVMLHRHLSPEESIFKGGHLDLKFLFYGFEVWGPWREILRQQVVLGNVSAPWIQPKTK